MRPEQIGEIAMIFLAFRNQLKIYHWQTTSYARHKASDRLISSITEQIDRFMETLQGSRDTRLVLTSQSGTISFNNQKDDNATEILVAFKEWLSDSLSSILQPFDKDLSNIRDEMLGSVNQTIYLFSLL
uniref:Uncharacterized protein n=1 Tax=viral metagenome TaxID=1070528 RepID=A0A6C0JT57_9ZZZZ